MHRLTPCALYFSRGAREGGEWGLVGVAERERRVGEEERDSKRERENVEEYLLEGGHWIGREG